MMNTAVKTLSHDNVSLTLPSWLFNFRMEWMVLILFACVIVSAFSVVYVRDMARQLTSQYQSLQNNYQVLRNEQSQYLLEESTWSARSRIETIARQKLSMEVPDANKIVVVENE